MRKGGGAITGAIPGEGKGMKKNVTPYIMLAPGIILMLLLVVYPIFHTFLFSLQEMKLTEPGNTRYIGLQNYTSIMRDPEFWYALSNSVVILVTVTVLTVVFGTLTALLLNVDSRIKGLLMAIAIIPWSLPPVVDGVMWRWIFHPSYGLLNRVLLRLHLIDLPVQWLSQRWPVIFIVSLVVASRCIPFCAIVILSAIRSVPNQIFEAASIDGSSGFQTFKRITLPLMLPSLGVVVTSTSITAINVFDEIVSLSGYGDASSTLMLQAYQKTFSFLDYGLGSAMTYIIMIFAGILGLVYIRNLYREVDYI